MFKSDLFVCERHGERRRRHEKAFEIKGRPEIVNVSDKGNGVGCVSHGAIDDARRTLVAVLSLAVVVVVG